MVPVVRDTSGRQAYDPVVERTLAAFGSSVAMWNMLWINMLGYGIGFDQTAALVNEMLFGYSSAGFSFFNGEVEYVFLQCWFNGECCWEWWCDWWRVEERSVTFCVVDVD